jgi:hypothetical protein
MRDTHRGDRDGFGRQLGRGATRENVRRASVVTLARAAAANLSVRALV